MLPELHLPCNFSRVRCTLHLFAQTEGTYHGQVCGVILQLVFGFSFWTPPRPKLFYVNMF